MKTTIALVIMMIKINSGIGQNLVTNPSFEIYSTCPSNSSQIEYATGWYSFGDSPDYFDTCSTSPDFSVPLNWGGYQQPASGKAYAGFGTYMTHQTGLINIHESIGGEITPLQIGMKYFVSFKVCLSISDYIDVNCATNNIGAAFTTRIYGGGGPETWIPISNNPQVFTNYIVTDTLNWTRIFGSFIADSSYKYIVIGNFFSDNNTDTLILTSDSYCNSYYYLDDVCLSTDSIFASSYTNSERKFVTESFPLVYPNPVDKIIYISVQNYKEPFDIIVYNAFGERLFTKEQIVVGTFQIDASEFNSGFLMVNLFLGSKSFKYKLLKQ